jgi:hypothetical protein
MITKAELQRWLNTLPDDDDGIYVGDCGIALHSLHAPASYLEVGGFLDFPNEEEQDES